MQARGLRLVEVPEAPDGPAVRRVLVVDDSRAQRKILCAYVKRLGFEPIEAGSGEEALDICRTQPVDMVISDWMMPGMDGIAFCRAFRAEKTANYTYFILLTSKTAKEEMAQGLDVGADDFLVKPVGFDELRARINAGERILQMERELQRQNRLAKAALTELTGLYESLDRDLIEARKLQQSLVRERRRSFAEGEVNLLLQPCGHVGGDLVGFFRIGLHGLGLYSIDVSGHGIASALLTARIAAYLAGSTPSRNLALGYDSRGNVIAHPPEQVAARLNKLILDEVDTGHYFTMALVTLDLQTGQAEMVQAGHPPPLLQAADGSVRPLGQGGMPIGLLPDAEFHRESFSMNPFERLFICSDGFSECANRQGRFLEEEGLIQLIRKRCDLQGGAFLEALVWDLASFAEDEDFSDDLSAVLFEYRGNEDPV